DILNSPVMVLAFIAFLTTMGREIFKDVEDVKGDKALGARTLPILVGGAISMNIARMFAALGALSAVLPYMSRMFGEYYIVSAMPCIGVLLYSTTQKDPEGAQKRVKTGMFLGIFAFLVGAYFG
ncbi:MAG: UbiA family prenyltransferase, partial [archaeon]|nr:UbiA family prenyltransferase [archaeon]